MMAHELGVSRANTTVPRDNTCMVNCVPQWSADGQSQLDLMHKDEVILLDFNDNVIGKSLPIRICK